METHELSSASEFECSLESAKARLRAKLGEDVYEARFKLIRFHSMRDGILTVSVPTRHTAHALTTFYGDELADAFRGVSPSVKDVAVVERSPTPHPSSLTRKDDDRMPMREHRPPKETPEPWPDLSIDAELIKEAIVAHYGLTPDEIISFRTSPHPEARRIRDIGIYLTRRHTRLTAASIGGMWGGLSHHTVKQIVSTIEETLSGGGRMATEIAQLRWRLGF